MMNSGPELVHMRVIASGGIRGTKALAGELETM